jgi:hypothetical protein
MKRILGILLVLWIALPGNVDMAVAQKCNVHRGDVCDAGSADRSRWQPHLKVLGINAALGGATAGALQWAGGGSFRRGFLHGAAGGGIIYTGKLISSETFWGAGFLGREVAAVGTSVVHNASEARAPLESLMLSAGPVRLYIRTDTAAPARLKLDLPSALVLVHTALSPSTTFHAGASLSAGAPVFLVSEPLGSGWHGTNRAGVILLLADSPVGFPADPVRTMVFSHERVHTIQYDQVSHAWSSHVDSWLLRRVPGGSWLERHVTLNVPLAFTPVLHSAVPYDRRPWEREAFFLSPPHKE